MIFTHTHTHEKKTIKYKGTYLNYITSSEFEKNGTYTSLGYIKPLKDKDLEDSFSIKTLEVDRTKFKIVNKKPLFSKTNYYINVVGDDNNENLYVALSKFNFFSLLIILVLLTLFTYLTIDIIKNPDKNVVKTVIDDFVDERPVTNNKPDEMLKPGEMAVPGYTNLYIYKGDAVYLNNPKVNSVTFKYIIKLNGSDKIIYESREIPAGKADEWYPTLDVGKYSVDFYIEVTRQDGSKGITPYIPNINLEIYNR